MIISSALARRTRWIATPWRAGGSFLAVVFLTLTISCGDGESSAPPAPDSTPNDRVTFDERSTVPPAPGPTATPNVEVIEIFPSSADGQSALDIGGNAWWDSKAPVTEFRAILPVLAGTPNGDAIWSLYAATFVASEWLSGREPDPTVFGSYVASFTLEELPDEANDLFGQVMALDPTSADWLRPYQFAETDEEFTLVVNLGFTACLSIATWDECVARASGG